MYVTASDATPLSIKMSNRTAAVGTAMRVRRAPDGLFRLAVMIDGSPFDMIVDTAATRTLLSSGALGAGSKAWIRPDRAGTIRTLTGDAPYFVKGVDTVRIGDRTIRNTEIAIFESERPVAVLGQDMLAQIGPMTIDGDWLYLH